MTTYQIMRRNTFIPPYQVLNSSSYIFPHTFNKHEKARLQRENDPERWPLSDHLLVVRESPSCWDNMVMCTGWLFTFMYDLSMILHLKCVIYSKGAAAKFFFALQTSMHLHSSKTGFGLFKKFFNISWKTLLKGSDDSDFKPLQTHPSSMTKVIIFLIPEPHLCHCWQ